MPSTRILPGTTMARCPDDGSREAAMLMLRGAGCVVEPGETEREPRLMTMARGVRPAVVVVGRVE